MASIEIDQYIAQFSPEIRVKLEEIRRIILGVAPDAQEVISYKMPAYKLKTILVYFAGYNNHIGFYPTGKGIEAFKHKLSDFKFSKGAVQFPIHEPLPKALIEEMVRFRLQDCQ